MGERVEGVCVRWNFCRLSRKERGGGERERGERGEEREGRGERGEGRGERGEGRGERGEGRGKGERRDRISTDHCDLLQL